MTDLSSLLLPTSSSKLNNPHMWELCRPTCCFKILLWSWDKWLKWTKMNNKFSHIWTANINSRQPMEAEQKIIKINEEITLNGRTVVGFKNTMSDGKERPLLSSNATIQVTLNNALNPLLLWSNCLMAISGRFTELIVTYESESTTWNNIQHVLWQHPRDNGFIK